MKFLPDLVLQDLRLVDFFFFSVRKRHSAGSTVSLNRNVSGFHVTLVEVKREFRFASSGSDFNRIRSVRDRKRICSVLAAAGGELIRAAPAVFWGLAV